jgi:hypothetical protein
MKALGLETPLFEFEDPDFTNPNLVFSEETITVFQLQTKLFEEIITYEQFLKEQLDLGI